MAWLIAPPLLVFAANPATDAAGLEFFEKHVRPVFIEHCHKCHSAEAEKLKGGLLLDTRDGLLKGGESGPALVPGHPDKSLLIKAVRYTDENLQMPPKGQRLTAEQVAHLEAWVKMGAPDPRDQKSEIRSQKAGEKHWAFQPVKLPAAPAVKNAKRVLSPVDSFILAKLEPNRLTLSPPADRRTLIRRATFDLIGLPPAPEEVAAFESDSSPRAFERLVERLLDSPRYGERWGRYWLDIARYADTKGYVFEEERRYAYAYTYRDWVIRAFNEDLPYDQFLIQQIAADRLPLGEDKRPLAALGFLTLGRRFLNNPHDIIDDRIDVVCRGTMALTVGCARCHDHKFDPVPTRDYYSLYGVFASSHEPGEKPLLGSAALPKEYPDYLEKKKEREKKLADYKQARMDETLKKLRAQVGDYLLAAHDATRLKDDGKVENLARERKLDPPSARRWKKRAEQFRTNATPIFGAWFAFTPLAETNFAEHAQTALASLSSNALNPVVAQAFPAGSPPASLKEVAQRYNKLFAGVDDAWREFAAQTNAPKAFPDAEREALRQILYGSDSPISSEYGELHRQFDTPAQQKIRALQREVDGLDATHPGAPPRAMALLDKDTPQNPRVFKRGSPGNPGDEVPRRFLEVLAGPQRPAFTNGSGRLELARAIASRDNPLTARVFVNRVWAYHFGAPMVPTPSDFGVRSDPPTHPELLDYLAARFMDEGWSIKKLHRQMMLSAAYQQGSDDNAAAEKVDPSNQLLWRMNRRRLDFEAMRDSLLAVSGKLDLLAGGPAVEITTDPPATRRTVYGFVERQNLPGLFRTFDFASPDATSPQRFHTTVPQQALYLMNSPFVVQQAKALLERGDVKAARDDDAKLRRLHQAAFQRAPDADELRLAREFLRAQPAEAATVPAPPPAWQYGWGEFDEATKRVKQFTPLPHFTKYAWQGGEKLPDATLGWVLLSADGGHPGDPRHAAIRRWTAPRDGLVAIRGELNHPGRVGDGVRARVVSSRKGELGQWLAFHTNAPTKLNRVEVKRGDTLDFVADCRHDENTDSFQWAPTVRYAAGTIPAGDDTP
ncbi:MAG: PSD1 and planctomycete cytochrome C domain-containing protein, partial [Hyphomicrobium sp.]